MRPRLKLHEKLCDILGSRNVYFQPPETLKMHYPCIVYSRGNGDTQFADNSTYTFEMRYDVTLIDPDPDSALVSKIPEEFEKIVHDRHYTANNLNHDVFRLYY